jgi:anti-sigma factor RsiW
MNDDTPREMACQELVDVITGYLEGTLPHADRSRFDAHLATCPACQEYLEQMRALVRLTGKLSPKSLEPATVDSLLGAFRRWRDSQTRL